MNVLADSSLGGLQVLAVGTIVLLIMWATTQSHRSDIAEAVRNLGAVPLSINWSPRFFAPRGAPREYEVRMRLPSGQEVTALCQCSMWTGVYWKDTPWLRLQQDHTRALAVGKCGHCGYALRAGWHCCPKCGTTVV